MSYFMMKWFQFGLQDGMSPSMEELIYFHDYVMMVLIYIMSVVSIFLMYLLNNTWINSEETSNQLLEFVWTVFPSIILISLAVPSLMILYWMEDLSSHSVTLKVTGNQWYWSYEYSDFSPQHEMAIDSFIINNSDSLRNLETDIPTPLPFKTPIRALVGSSDVLHSWAVPSLGVKIDANPGRLNQTFFSSSSPGVMFGQCSEICGANHSFMPITIEFISFKDFFAWMSV